MLKVPETSKSYWKSSKNCQTCLETSCHVAVTFFLKKLTKQVALFPPFQANPKNNKKLNIQLEFSWQFAKECLTENIFAGVLNW